MLIYFLLTFSEGSITEKILFFQQIRFIKMYIKFLGFRLKNTKVIVCLHYKHIMYKYMYHNESGTLYIFNCLCRQN